VCKRKFKRFEQGNAEENASINDLIEDYTNYKKEFEHIKQIKFTQLDKLKDLKNETNTLIKKAELVSNEIDLLKGMKELQVKGNAENLKANVTQMQDEIKKIKQKITEKVIY